MPPSRRAGASASRSSALVRTTLMPAPRRAARELAGPLGERLVERAPAPERARAAPSRWRSTVASSPRAIGPVERLGAALRPVRGACAGRAARAARARRSIPARSSSSAADSSSATRKLEAIDGGGVVGGRAVLGRPRRGASRGARASARASAQGLGVGARDRARRAGEVGAAVGDGLQRMEREDLGAALGRRRRGRRASVAPLMWPTKRSGGRRGRDRRARVARSRRRERRAAPPRRPRQASSDSSRPASADGEPGALGRARRSSRPARPAPITASGSSAAAPRRARRGRVRSRSSSRIGDTRRLVDRPVAVWPSVHARRVAASEL